MEKNIIEKEIIIDDHNIINEIFGRLDENSNIIKEKFNINILLRDSKVKIIGETKNVELAGKLIYDLIEIIKSQNKIDKHDLLYSIDLVLKGKEGKIKQLLNEIIMVTSSGKTLKPKTLGQKEYIDAIKDKDIVFGIGPAGTGKTYLAMAMAIKAFKNKEVDRIILTRPAVEAGENLGFLPGDLQEKVDPYLRPVYDALFDIMGSDHYLKYLEKGLIEVAPLAYMRGRTLDNSYVILDEAQNTTNEQMKMFLTRIGFGSKAIITGDITQIDLPKGKESGLKNAIKVLSYVKGIQMVYLSAADIVRHPLVQRIVVAYEKYEKDK